MFLLDDQSLILSATDLTNHLACGHLTQERLAIARNERAKPKPADDPHGDLIRKRGDEHEAEQLAVLVAEADGEHVDLTTSWDDPDAFTRAGMEAATNSTLEAMRDGVALISQPTLFDGQWQGRPDVLRRVDVPSDLGAHSYEVLDMKLARQVKPRVVHQLCLYDRLVAGLQGRSTGVGYVLLGDGTEQAIELTRYAALHRHVSARLEEVARGPAEETYPEPVGHCGICVLSAECRERIVADDHLSLVAGARRDQRVKLVDVGLSTVAALGAAPPDHDRGGLAAERFDLLRNQAGLQVISRDTGKPVHRHLEPAAERGYAGLPEPDPADIFFDLEGDPYVGTDGGIEYLWGWCDPDGAYECIWAHDTHEERAAFEQFVRFAHKRWKQHPGMHIFHYAPHESSKLKNLSVQYATCEDEVDALLRAGVLVDLYAVVRQGLQVGEESYSLKKLERHHDFERLEHAVREGGGSIIAYENWLATRDGEFLESIKRYNAEDCVSTLSLRDWLHAQMLPEAVREFGPEAFVPAEPEEPGQPPAWLADVESLVERLHEGLDADEEDDDPDQAERRLLGHLLLYHHREAKPEWWRYFDLRSKTPEELLEERDALSCLRRDETRAPEPYKQSLECAFTFPPQEFKLAEGRVLDPTTGAGHNLVRIEDDYVVVRCKADKPEPEPAALIGGGPVRTDALREALVAVAEDLLGDGSEYPAARSILRRESPRLAAGTLGPDVDALVSATLGLDHSHLAVQGPPGTGKTWRGARMVVEAVTAGKRVGVTAQSHAAIHNLLRDIETYAHARGIALNAVYKGEGYESAHELVESVDSNEGTVDDDYRLIAGTSWLLARADWRGELDLVFVDEAGQFSLANAVAVATAADSVVLLGDPQQLPQVTQASHPGVSGRSVLEHHLASSATVEPERGVLLDESWRMHPEVCAFVSERSYDGRLRSRDACARRKVEPGAGVIAGSGLRFVPVEHEGCSQVSVGEAERIAQMCRELLASGSVVTDDEGNQAELRARDIMVVAPYNMAVRCIGDVVPEGVRVGTVDKFQGQQAPIVFFAMTCSSGEDVPRGLDFLFSQHRFNVAVSRAQCVAVVVASPRLLDSDCRTLEAMELVDGVCRFVEMAT